MSKERHSAHFHKNNLPVQFPELGLWECFAHELQVSSAKSFKNLKYMNIYIFWQALDELKVIAVI